MTGLDSTDLALKVYYRFDGKIPYLGPFPERSVDLHAIVKATLEELIEAGFLTVEAQK